MTEEQEKKFMRGLTKSIHNCEEEIERLDKFIKTRRSGFWAYIKMRQTAIECKDELLEYLDENGYVYEY